MSSNITLKRKNLHIVKSNDDQQSKLIRTRMGISVSDFVASLESSDPLSSPFTESSVASYVWPKHTFYELFDGSRPVYQYNKNDISWAVRFRALGCYHSCPLTPNSNETDFRDEPLTHSTPPDITGHDISFPKKSDGPSFEPKEKIRFPVDLNFGSSAHPPSYSLTSYQQHQLEEDLKLSDSDDGDLDATKPMREDENSSAFVLGAAESQRYNYPGTPLKHNIQPSIVHSSPVEVSDKFKDCGFPISPGCAMDCFPAGNDELLNYDVANEVVISTEPESPVNPVESEHFSVQSAFHSSRTHRNAVPRSKSSSCLQQLNSCDSIHDEVQVPVVGSPPSPHFAYSATQDRLPSYTSEPSLSAGKSKNVEQSTTRRMIRRLLDESASVLAAKSNCYVTDISPDLRHQLSANGTLAPPGKENRSLSNHTAESDKVLDKKNVCKRSPAYQSQSKHSPSDISSDHSADAAMPNSGKCSDSVVSSRYHSEKTQSQKESSSVTSESHPGKNYSDDVSTETECGKHQVIAKPNTKAKKKDKLPVAKPPSGVDRVVMPPPVNEAKHSKRTVHVPNKQVDKDDAIAIPEPTTAVNNADTKLDVTQNGVPSPILSNPVRRVAPEKPWLFSGIALTKVRAKLQQIVKQSATNRDGTVTRESIVEQFRSVLQCASSSCSSENKTSLADNTTSKNRPRPLTGVLLIPSTVSIPQVDECSVDSIGKDSSVTLIDASTITSPPSVVDVGVQCLIPPVSMETSGMLDPTGALNITSTGSTIRSDVDSVVSMDSNEPAHSHSSSLSIGTHIEELSFRDSTPEIQIGLAEDCKTRASRYWKSLVNGICKAASSSVQTSSHLDRSQLLLQSDDLHMYPVQLIKVVKHLLCAAHLCILQNDFPRSADLLAKVSAHLTHLIHRLQRVGSKLTKSRVRNVTDSVDADQIKREASWLQLWHYGLTRLRAVVQFQEHRVRSRSVTGSNDKVNDCIAPLNLPSEVTEATTEASGTISAAIPSKSLQLLIRHARLNEIVQRATDDWELSESMVSQVPRWTAASEQSSLTPLDNDITRSNGNFLLNFQSSAENLFAYIDGLVRAHFAILQTLKSNCAKVPSEQTSVLPPSSSSACDSRKSVQAAVDSCKEDLKPPSNRQKTKPVSEPNSSETKRSEPEGSLPSNEPPKLKRPKKRMLPEGIDDTKQSNTAKQATCKQNSNNTACDKAPKDDPVFLKSLCKSSSDRSASGAKKRNLDASTNSRLQSKIKSPSPVRSTSPPLSRIRQRSRSLAPADQRLHSLQNDREKNTMYHPKRIRRSNPSDSDGSDASPPIPAYKPSRTLDNDSQAMRSVHSGSVGRSRARDSPISYSPTRSNLIDGSCNRPDCHDPVPVYRASKINTPKDVQSNGYPGSPTHQFSDDTKIRRMPSFYSRWKNDSSTIKPSPDRANPRR